MLLYFRRFKTFRLSGQDFLPRLESVERFVTLGTPAGADPLYYEFALKYFRIFLFCTFIVGQQILSASSFPLSERSDWGRWSLPEPSGIFPAAPSADLSADLRYRRYAVGRPRRRRSVQRYVAAAGPQRNAAVELNSAENPGNQEFDDALLELTAALEH